MAPLGRRLRYLSLWHYRYAWALGALLIVAPLQDSRPADARSEFNRTERLFLHGHLEEAQRDAHWEYEHFALSNPAGAERFRLLEAEAMVWRGDSGGALRVLAGGHFGADPEEAVKRLSIEGLALLRLQGPSPARERLSEADNLCRSGKYLACGDALLVHGVIAGAEARFAEARQLFLDARSFALDHRDRFLETKATLNLGWAALQIGHFDEAMEWSRSAYQSAVQLGAEDLAQRSSGNLGWAYFQLGDNERALEKFLAAEKAAAQLGNIGFELKWLLTAGYVYRDLDDDQRAAHLYRQALDLARQIDSKEDIAITLEDLANVSLLAGNLNDADSYISQLKSIGRLGTGRADPNFVIAIASLAEARKQFAQAENDYRPIQNDPASPTWAKLYAGSELASLYESQDNFDAAERMYKSTLATYEKARAELKNEESQLPYGTNAVQIYDHYVHLLVRRGKTGEALAVADQSRAQTLEQSLHTTSDTKVARQSALNPQQIASKTNSTLLFYWLGKEQSYLWAITSHKTTLFTLPAQSQIAARIESYSQALLDLQDPLESSDPDGQALYKMLVAPAASLIRPGTPVIVLADGILSQLNFETLLVPGAAHDSPRDAVSNAQLHYLLDDFIVSSAPSLAMLAAAEPLGPEKPNILLIGNPASEDHEFPSLPFFEKEMTRIEGRFPPSEISALAGSEATPAAYLSSVPSNYTYIHFVSHAVASRTSPLDSAIILSNPAGRDDSYKLYAREIIERPIHARLVTISACYGTGTRSYAGEGLVGLSWAFLRAGAQRVIGALWEVADDSTPRLMDTLYQGLTAGESPAIALRNAKLPLLHSHSRFRAPFYWAPFQIYSRR